MWYQCGQHQYSFCDLWLRTDLCHHTALTLGPDSVFSWSLTQLLRLVEEPVALIYQELFVQASCRCHRHCGLASLTVGGCSIFGQSLQCHHSVLGSSRNNKKKINQSTVNDLVKHQKNKNILIFTVFLFYCSFLVNKSGNNLPVYHIYSLYMWLCWCVVLVLRRSHRMGSAAEPASGRCWRSSPSQSWTEQDQSGAPTACRRSSPPPGSPTPSLMLLFWLSDGGHLSVNKGTSSVTELITVSLSGLHYSDPMKVHSPRVYTMLILLR